MNTPTSIFVPTLVLSLLTLLGGCVPAEPAGTGSGGSGSGGKASGGAGSGGAGSGGSTGSGGSGTGSGGAASGSGGSGADTPPATFATVRVVVDFYCGGADCHAAGDRMPALENVTDDAKLYATLTTFKAKLCGDRVLVSPGAPQNSAFYLAQADMCDPLDRMPKGCVDGCTAPPYLEAIRQWIANGAPRN